jgi:ActR/RegA family two-component response regulator
MKLMPRVLLMDDEVVFRQSFKQVLQRQGLDVRIATSVPHLIKMAKEDRYDAGIIDIRMTEGGSEGLGAIQQLVGMQPEMYVEVITAYEEYVSAALKMGADAVFIKPGGTDGADAAKRVRMGILKKRLNFLGKVAGVDWQELLDARLLDEGSQSAWAAVKASILADCILQMDSFLESIAETHRFDRHVVGMLRRDLAEFLVTRVVETQVQPTRRGIPIAPELVDDVNFKEYINSRDVLRRDYLGQYVAFVDGKLVEADFEKRELLRKVNEGYGSKAAFIKKITAEERTVVFRRPKRVKRR